MPKKKIGKKNNSARFICCITIFWPNGKTKSSTGIIKGKISKIKKVKMVLVMIQFLYQMVTKKLLVK